MLTFYIEYIVILSRDSYSFYYIVIQPRNPYYLYLGNVLILHVTHKMWVSWQRICVRRKRPCNVWNNSVPVIYWFVLLITVYEKFDNEQNWCKFLPLVLFDHHTGPKCFFSLHLAQDQDATVKLIWINCYSLFIYKFLFTS